MALNLPANLIIEKNKLATPNPWIILLDIKLPNDTVLYFCKNNEDVVFQGRTYNAINFEIEPTKATSKGEIPTVTLRVSNVTRILQAYLEEYNGGVGSQVTVRVVNTAYLDEDYSELEMTFDVISAEADAYWITFTLGAPNPLLRRFPPDRYIADYCRWEFKSAECGYTGPATTCNKTLENCRRLGNSKRFGGFPGLTGGYLRVV